MNIQDFEIKALEAATLLKHLASQPRLMLLCHLADGEKSVGRLAELTGLRMSTVSQHLALLRAHDLVSQRREGTTIHYKLANETVRALIGVLYQAYCGPGEAA